MCKELKELTVRDAIMESLYHLWKMGKSRQIMVPLTDCPDTALNRIISVPQNPSKDQYDNIKSMLCCACKFIEEFEEDFEPEYDISGYYVDETLNALYDLRLTLLDIIDGDCG